MVHVFERGSGVRSWQAGRRIWKEEFWCRKSERKHASPIWAELLIGAAADVRIVFTGCRPGDKLSEELISKAETREGTIGARCT